MSGGSYDYAYRHIEELSVEVAARASGSSCPPLRLAFAQLLAKVAVAARDLEWVDSCDRGPGDEVASIEAVVSPGAEVSAAVAEAYKALAQLNAAIERAGK